MSNEYEYGSGMKLLIGVVVAIGIAMAIAIGRDVASKRTSPEPPRTAVTDSMSHSWTHQFVGYYRSGGYANTKTSFDYSGGGSDYAGFGLTCNLDDARRVYKVNYRIPRHAPYMAGIGTLALAVDGEPLAEVPARVTREGEVRVRANVPVTVQGALAAGDELVVQYRTETDTFDTRFTLHGSASTIAHPGDCSPTQIRAARERGVADAKRKREQASRDAAVVRAQQAKRNDMCTNGAEFMKLLGTWYLDLGGGRGAVTVRSAFPRDSNKIIALIEAIGYGDPVPYNSIPGVC